jgi:RES domain-containing protein
MTPLPPALGGGPDLIAWRLDAQRLKSAWDSGEGARRAGGRWNRPGHAVVYASIDPSTTILERAVHAGFAMLDAVPHVLTSFAIGDPKLVRVLRPEEMPDKAWLAPGLVDEAQQAFGDALLADHPFVAVPSVVSTRSWNLCFDPVKARGAYALLRQEKFTLDGRLRVAGPRT